MTTPERKGQRTAWTRPPSLSFAGLREQYETMHQLGYRFITCEEYVGHKQDPIENKVVVNRVDIDFSVTRASRVASLMNELGIKATFFVRLHAPEYNPFGFEEYRILTEIRDAGHELGYHSEVVDQASAWNQDPDVCLRRDLEVFGALFGELPRGVASHGGLSALNNLWFWETRRPQDFGLLYETYDKEPAFNLFQESLYVSDSAWTHWKCYDRGRLVDGDHRTPAEHAREGPTVMALLIHPDTYCDRHFYE